MKRKRKPWRTERDDFILRIYGWGQLINYTRGYDVRFPRSHGHPHKYFSVKRYGSEARALQAARVHRDKLLAASGEPERRNGMQRRSAPFMIRKRKTNTSGVIGITLNKGCWLAFCHPRPGKQVRRAWSIKKYTNDGARQLAILWRAEMTNKLRRKR